MTRNKHLNSITITIAEFKLLLSAEARLKEINRLVDMCENDAISEKNLFMRIRRFASQTKEERLAMTAGHNLDKLTDEMAEYATVRDKILAIIEGCYFTKETVTLLINRYEEKNLIPVSEPIYIEFILNRLVEDDVAVYDAKNNKYKLKED